MKKVNSLQQTSNLGGIPVIAVIESHKRHCNDDDDS